MKGQLAWTRILCSTIVSCLHFSSQAVDATSPALPTGFVALPDVANKSALVIGVQKYISKEEGGPGYVSNAESDALAVDASLREAGFTFVRMLPSPTSKEILDGIDELVRHAQPDSQPALLLVYFAGHGVQVDGTNLIVPRGARNKTLIDDSLPISTLLSKISTDEFSLGILILDACRTLNVPGDSGWTIPMQSTDGAGFQNIHENDNTIIMLSTRAGRNSLSFSRSDEKHSPFTLELSRQIRLESTSIAQVYRYVYSAVTQETNDAQTPVLLSVAAATGVYLRRGPKEDAADKADWEKALAENRRNCLKDYLKAHPVGNYASSAKYLLSLLGNQPTSEPKCLLSP